MKNSVFARPNLKLLFLGALLIAAVQNFFANENSQETFVHARLATGPKIEAATELSQLLEEAQSVASSDLYIRISRSYERQGDLKKALFYLRKAQLAAQLEGEND
jgi:hypothetical protein